MGLPFLDSFSAAAGRSVWHADELGLADAQVVATGHAALDAQLPGGGWPVGAMTELLQTAPEAHVWRLLLPALAQAVQAHGGPVVLVGAPYEPCAAALAAQGLPVEALMWVRSDAPAARLWACEQALRCADVSAVLAWLPQAGWASCAGCSWRPPSTTCCSSCAGPHRPRRAHRRRGCASRWKAARPMRRRSNCAS